MNVLNENINSIDSNNKDISFVCNTILMVRPTNFCTNFETLTDNKLMAKIENKHNDESTIEFDNYVKLLKENQINVNIYDQPDFNATDSIFPNNWFSTHSDKIVEGGLLIIYPVKSKLRRLEKNPKIIEYLKPKYKHYIDLSYLEESNEFLESTGCLIFNYDEKIIYCSLSERATNNAINQFIVKFNEIAKEKYELVLFESFDKEGNSIYHTNCVMAVLKFHIIICSESVNKFSTINLKTKKKIIELSYFEMINFSSNIINVENINNELFLLISQRGYENLKDENKIELSKNYKFIIVDIKNIENIGGGSARCMVAEIFN